MSTESWLWLAGAVAVLVGGGICLKVLQARGKQPLKHPTLNAVGIMGPPGFNAAAYDAVHRQVSNLNLGATNEWYLYGSGWNAVVYRYRAALEHEERFTSLVSVSASPRPEDRYAQENALFGFIVSAASAIEAFCFAVNFLGGFAKQPAFAVSRSKDLQFVPNEVANRLEAAFPGEPLTVKVREVLSSPEYARINDFRRVLFHRGTPPRLYNVGDPTKPAAATPINPRDLPSDWRYAFGVDAQMVRPLRDWLVSALDKLMDSAREFAEKHLIP